MKKLFVGIIVGLAIGALGMRLMTGDAAPAKPGAAETAAPAKAEPKKANPLQLDAAKRAAAGIALAKPASITITPEIKGYGRTLDVTPLVALVAEEETAKASLAASEKELARVRQLFANDGNASAQAVETAEAAAARDRVAVGSARRRLATTWA